MKPHFMILRVFTLLLLSLLIGTPCYSADQQNAKGSPQTSVSITTAKPVALSQDILKQGLTVTYYLKFFKRNLSYINEMKTGEFESLKGKPITHLDHQFGKTNVFDSGTNRGVAMRMKGYLYFPESGTYNIQALSNDGIFVYISDTLAISDPKQHADRLSNITQIVLDKAGWLPVTVEYFQRKGTAAIRLLWQTPGSNTFVPIPASSYGHKG